MASSFANVIQAGGSGEVTGIGNVKTGIVGADGKVAVPAFGTPIDKVVK